MKNTERDAIIALDFPNREQTLEFLDLFSEEKKPFVKIGMELFYASGPDMVREIKARGHRIFLDLKLHDIPNTVKRTMAVLSGLDIDMVNLHASGGSEMMKAALEGLTRPDGTRPLLIAVTQLTSTDERMLHDELLIEASMNRTVMRYAQNAASCGLDGVVCSPLEAARIKEECDARYSFCRFRCRGSEAHYDPGRCRKGRLRLYRNGKADNKGLRPCRRIPPCNA